MRLGGLLRKWCRNQEPAVLPDQTKGRLGPCHQISIHPQSTGLGLKDVPDLLPKHRPPPHPADMAENTHACIHSQTRTHSQSKIPCASFIHVFKHVRIFLIPLISKNPSGICAQDPPLHSLTHSHTHMHFAISTLSLSVMTEWQHTLHSSCQT